ncbi:MAG: hypothetical protein QOH15_1741 [Gaiellales bacterium]|jgi:hypothetical protein|nr:hypothetical protein [Gaiellales bacterium]
MTTQADFKARVRARMSKTGESYTAARAQLLEEAPTSPARPDSTLHLTNGDATVPGLQAMGLGGTIEPWRDVLHEGPVPDVPEADLRRIRSRFLETYGAAGAGTELEFSRRDQTLVDHRDGEYVLWFEADLYDQLQLIQILARLHDLEVPASSITLICIGEFPGIAHFGGLGELDSDQLARLPGMAATALTSAGLRHATRAWAAFRAADPSGIAEITATPSRELRFVAEAFDRLSREYPSTRDGLSLTERRILAAFGDDHTAAGAAFVQTGTREIRPYLGDYWSFNAMARLLTASVPLLESERGVANVTRHTRLRLTDFGRRVLEGSEDYVTTNGIDRWIGGVHLAGHLVPWRWNEGTESITAEPR